MFSAVVRGCDLVTSAEATYRTEGVLNLGTLALQSNSPLLRHGSIEVLFKFRWLQNERRLT